MWDEIRRKDFEAEILPHLCHLRLTSLWLTKHRPDADELVQNTVAKAYCLWRPTLSRTDCRVLLFRVLTWLFFGGIEKRPAILSSNHKRILAAEITQRRLGVAQVNAAGIGGRTIVRLPVEIGFVKLLSKLGGFSSDDIAKIIGFTQYSIESRIRPWFSAPAEWAIYI